MKMNEKMKKRVAIGGCTIIGIALVAAIGLQFSKAPAQADALPHESPTNSEVSVSPPETVKPTSPTEEKEVVVQPNPIAPATPESSQAVDSRPAQTDQTEQSIQPEVTKPVITEEQKKDQTQKPNGEKVTSEPEVVDHDTYTPPADTPKSNEPQGGSKKDGQIYVPGFGWIDDVGEGQGSTADDMYENGNKIGDMG